MLYFEAESDTRIVLQQSTPNYHVTLHDYAYRLRTAEHCKTYFANRMVQLCLSFTWQGHHHAPRLVNIWANFVNLIDLKIGNP